LGDYADIEISVSDGRATVALPPFSLTVLAQVLGESNFVAEGQVTPTADGFRSEGDLVMDTGERSVRFEDADLTLAFDPDGKLIDFSGETLLPREPVENVTIDSPVRAIVGTMTGAEINADEAFGIRLVDATRYFVFFMSVSVDITIGDRGNPGAVDHITLETPAAGEILLILDPTDPFFYHFGSQPLIGEYGKGESENGLIPFVPELPHPALDSFYGHEIEKGAFSIGTRFFDFFDIAGMRVTRNPQFSDIDWNDPLSSSIEFKAGMNGDASFAFAILSVGLFSFDLAETSATLDVGLDRQNMAMQTRIAPDVSWVPDWFPFVPTTEIVGDWFLNGDGEFEASLRGSYQSTVPPADIAGSIVINNDATTLTGTTTDAAGELTVSAEFASNVTTARVEFDQDFAGGIGSAVLGELDRQLAAVEQALEDLENAVADYEFELSLRGLRSLLPGIADGAIAVLNAVPDQVRDAADDATVSYIQNACVIVIFEVCLADLVDETAIGNSVGATARSQAVTAIGPYITSLQNLKTQAQSADSEALREALRLALLSVYNNQVFSRRFTINYAFPSPFGSVTVYDATFTRRIIPEATAAQILTAANNVYRITETSNIRISAQAIFDALPTEQILSTVRQEVADGVTDIPTLEGLGAVIQGGAVDAFVTIDGADHPVAFNVFRPADVLAGVGELLVELLIGDAE
jgi:hypothetical protein